MLEKEGLGFLTTSRFYTGFMTLVPRSDLSHHWLFSHWVELASKENKQITRKQIQHLISMYWHGESAFSRILAEWEMEGSEVYNLHLVSPLFCVLHFPLISSCLAVPSTLCDFAGGVLRGDQLKGWAVWDRWADDGSDVIDSRVMDGWMADRGLMQCWGRCCTVDGLVIDR